MRELWRDLVRDLVEASDMKEPWGRVCVFWFEDSLGFGWGDIGVRGSGSSVTSAIVLDL